MLIVIVPVCTLIMLILFKKIPVIKGNVVYALVSSALLALLLGKVMNPLAWMKAWLDGLDRLSWVMFLAVFGSIYASTQTRLKTLDLVIDILRALFGKSSKSLICVVILALSIAGSLLGDAVASATVIGMLVVGILQEIGLSGEEIAATVTMGSLLGSIMPPITQAVFLSASLAGASIGEVTRITYVTIAIAMVLSMVYCSLKFVRIKKLPEHLIPKQRPCEIIQGKGYRLVPLSCLVGMVILFAGFDVDISVNLLNPVIKFIGEIPVIKGMTNSIVMFLIFATVIAFLFPHVRKNGASVIKEGFTNAMPGLKIQMGAAFLLGAFYMGGQIELVKEFAIGLNENMMKIGGALSEVLIGCLTGSQSTAQNTIFSFFSQALIETGTNPVYAAVSSAHLASGAQALPPTSMTVLVVAGLISGILGKEINPVKCMILCLPLSLYLIFIGVLFLYV